MIARVDGERVIDQPPCLVVVPHEHVGHYGAVQQREVGVVGLILFTLATNFTLDSASFFNDFLSTIVPVCEST